MPNASDPNDAARHARWRRMKAKRELKQLLTRVEGARVSHYLEEIIVRMPVAGAEALVAKLRARGGNDERSL